MSIWYGVPFACMHPEGPNSVHKLSFFLCRFNMESLLLLWTPESWNSALKWSLFLCLFDTGSFLLICTQRDQTLSINCPFSNDDLIWVLIVVMNPRGLKIGPLAVSFSISIRYGVLFTHMHQEGRNLVHKLSFFLYRYDKLSLFLVWTQKGRISVHKLSFFQCRFGLGFLFTESTQEGHISVHKLEF